MFGFRKGLKFTLSGALYLFSVACSPWQTTIGVALFLLVPLLLVWFPEQINRATVDVTNPDREPSSLFGGDAFVDIPTPGWLLAAIGWIILAGGAGYVLYLL